MYCTRCGASLMVDAHSQHRYSLETGEMLYKVYYYCPNNKRIMGIFNTHDSIDGMISWTKRQIIDPRNTAIRRWYE